MGKIGREARNDARVIARHPRIEAEQTASCAPKGVCRRFGTSQAPRPLPARWIPACRKAFAGASVLRKLHVHPSARRLPACRKASTGASVCTSQVLCPSSARRLPACRKAFDGASLLLKLRVCRLQDGFPRAERRLVGASVCTFQAPCLPSVRWSSARRRAHGRDSFSFCVSGTRSLKGDGSGKTRAVREK